MTESKHVHFIGICGVGMSAIAIALHKAGWKVTGSDKGFYPPVSDNLKSAGVPYYAGFHPEKMTEDGVPDMVIVGNASGGDKNPEFAYVKEQGIPYHSFPSFLGEYFIKENSIVACGTWGKTSSSGLLSHILRATGFEPSYMIGAVPVDMPPAELTDSDWSVTEGDEYTTARFDDRPKFAHYKPTHLLLTGVKHDHFDKYPSEEGYFEVFKALVEGVPESGLIVANKSDEGVKRVLEGAKVGARVVSYGSGDCEDCRDYYFDNVEASKNGLVFEIVHGGVSYPVESPLLGHFQAENITACFAVAKESGIEPGKVLEAIKSFGGIKRRLQKRHEGAVTVIDDIAHSADKARSIVGTLKEIYDGELFVVYEPNTGNRKPDSIASYKDVFEGAHEVIIPRLTKLKVDESIPESERPMDGLMLAEEISKQNPKTQISHIDDDDDLVDYIIRKAQSGDVIAFLGSGGFRGMIEETVNKLS